MESEEHEGEEPVREERPKCSEHGLVTGEDGRCVVCRRADASQRSSANRLFVGSVALFFAGLALYAGYRYGGLGARTPGAGEAGDVVPAADPAAEPATPGGANARAGRRPAAASHPDDGPAPRRPDAREAAPNAAQPDPAAEAARRKREREKAVAAAMRRVHVKMYMTRW